MADKHEGSDDFQVEKGRSWTHRRSEIRKCSQIRENVRMSLQPLDVFEVANRLAGIAGDKKKFARSTGSKSGRTDPCA